MLVLLDCKMFVTNNIKKKQLVEIVVTFLRLCIPTSFQPRLLNKVMAFSFGWCCTMSM